MSTKAPTQRQGGSASVEVRAWTALFVLLATSLWAQWLGPGALAEVRSEDGSVAVMTLQALPLLAVVGAINWDHPAGRLAVFPASFIPGLAVLAEAEWEFLLRPGVLALSLVTFALYLLVATSHPRQQGALETARRGAQRPDRDRYARQFRRFVVLRATVALFWFALITYALFVAPSTAEALQAMDSQEAARTQHLFAAVVVYFGWTIATYMGAVLPALNWEYHRRRSVIPPAQQRLLSDPRRLGRRIWIWIALLGVGTAAAVMML